MTIKEKQTALANMAHDRGLIDNRLRDTLANSKASYDVIEVLFSIIEQPNENSLTFLTRMCQYTAR